MSFADLKKRKAKEVLLKIHSVWNEINRPGGLCFCEDCISSRVTPLREVAEKNDFWGFDQGRSKWVFMNDEWAIKIPRTRYLVQGARHEAGRMYRWFTGGGLISKYVVETRPYRDGFMLQRIVEPITEEQFKENRVLIEALAIRYDIVDLGEYNVGWAQRDIGHSCGYIQLFDCPSNEMEQKMFEIYLDLHNEGRRLNHANSG